MNLGNPLYSLMSTSVAISCGQIVCRDVCYDIYSNINEINFFDVIELCIRPINRHIDINIK